MYRTTYNVSYPADVKRIEEDPDMYPRRKRVEFVITLMCDIQMFTGELTEKSIRDYCESERKMIASRNSTISHDDIMRMLKDQGLAPGWKSESEKRAELFEKLNGKPIVISPVSAVLRVVP